MARGRDLRCVYEGGGAAWVGALRISEWAGAIGCEVAAPALTPRRPGQEVKTGRRDADKLGRLYRAGELTLIRAPEEGQEALRDLVRARERALEDGKEDLLRRRHRLSKFLLRHGIAIARDKTGPSVTGRLPGQSTSTSSTLRWSWRNTFCPSTSRWSRSLLLARRIRAGSAFSSASVD